MTRADPNFDDPWMVASLLLDFPPSATPNYVRRQPFCARYDDGCIDLRPFLWRRLLWGSAVYLGVSIFHLLGGNYR